MEQMLGEVKWCKQTMKKHFNKPLKMTHRDEKDFQKATKCHICDQQYKEKDIQVRDHRHIIGKFQLFSIIFVIMTVITLCKILVK